MQIKEATTQLGLSARSLRHYERTGLLVPQRDANGYPRDGSSGRIPGFRCGCKHTEDFQQTGRSNLIRTAKHRRLPPKIAYVRPCLRFGRQD